MIASPPFAQLCKFLYLGLADFYDRNKVGVWASMP